MNIQFKDPKQAFNKAIQDGRLSTNTTDSHYAGNYMYMGTQNLVDENTGDVSELDCFKHIDTRQYLAK